MLNIDLPTIISRILVLVIAFTIHEFSHAFVATRLGDDTPRLAGRLTLNPIAHLDLLGTILLLIAGFGWAKPVPVNPYAVNRKTRAGMLLVSFAGPFSNLLLAILAAIPLRFGWISINPGVSNILPSMGEFLLEFIVINITLFLFNLIPLAPLDGEKVMDFLLPRAWEDTYHRIKVYGPYILILIAIIGPRLGFDLLGILIRQPMIWITRLLIGRG